MFVCYKCSIILSVNDDMFVNEIDGWFFLFTKIIIYNKILFYSFFFYKKKNISLLMMVFSHVQPHFLTDILKNLFKVRVPLSV